MAGFNWVWFTWIVTLGTLELPVAAIITCATLSTPAVLSAFAVKSILLLPLPLVMLALSQVAEAGEIEIVQLTFDEILKESLLFNTPPLSVKLVALAERKPAGGESLFLHPTTDKTIITGRA